MDWTQFELNINIKCSRKEAFDMWNSSAALESWFLKSAKFSDKAGIPIHHNDAISEGAHYIWQWYTYEQYVGIGKIIKIRKDEFIAFSFMDMPVTIEFNENKLFDGEIIVTLKQMNIPTDEESKMNNYSLCKAAWSFHLTNYKSVLEGGLDLRGKDTPGMLNN